MDPQNNQPTNQPVNTPTNPVEPTQGTPTSNVQVATPAGNDGNPGTGVIDLSLYFKDGEPGVFDGDKIAALVKERDNKAKSASYFQSEFMKKNEVPSSIEGYAEHFKADSVYEKFMENETVQNTLKEIREWGLKNNISPTAVNSFCDMTLKKMVADGSLDSRTPEQIQEESAKATAAEQEKLKPFLDSVHRSFDDQTKLITKFFDTPSVFTNDPEVKELLQSACNESAVAYKAISYLIDAIEFGGYKALPTQGESLGMGAAEFWNKYNAETDPVKREAMLAEFEKTNPQK
ncbi:MAG: hypothetical protein IKV10_02670 [Alphaproteobacteria bacterium]|nr:hypothetical protein [Alphaproteobacteria bacterium]MBR4860180.1 hypothetical protein [Alphaproteobacteria bacterium]